MMNHETMTYDITPIERALTEAFIASYNEQNVAVAGTAETFYIYSWEAPEPGVDF